MSRILKFTIWHGIAVSLILHSGLALPFVLHISPPPPDQTPLLVMDLQGLIADTQTDQKVMQEIKGEAVKQAEQEPPQEKQPAEEPTPAAPLPPTDPPPPVAEDGDRPALPPPAIAKASSPKPSHDADANNVKGAEVRQDAQRLRAPETERDLTNAYAILLNKKVQANKVYPENGRSGSARVAFTIMISGDLRPGSLRIAESSGQAVLDASALKTIRASAPFDPPPRELNLAIVVVFPEKR